MADANLAEIDKRHVEVMVYLTLVMLANPRLLKPPKRGGRYDRCPQMFVLRERMVKATKVSPPLKQVVEPIIRTGPFVKSRSRLA